MADNTPRVAIGIPVYNGANFLATALDSVLSQTFTDFTVIISDNASTDETMAISRDYAARDARIQYHRLEVNLGAGPNYDRVFELSDSEFFQWLAHDDYLYPTFLAETVAALDAQPDAGLAYTRCANIDPAGNVIDIERPRHELASNLPHERLASAIFSGHNTYPIFGLMRSAVLRTTDLHGHYTGSDRVLLADLAMSGPCVEIDEVLFGYRRHPEQSIQLDAVRQKSGLLAHPREVWYDVSRAGRITFPNWRRMAGYISAVGRSPSGAGEKARSYWELVKWLVDRNWKKLILDLATSVVVLFRKLAPNR